MSDVVIRVENLSKEYRLGSLGYGSFYQDFQSFYAKLRGREDPNAPISLCPKNDQADSTAPGDMRFLALDDISFDIRRGEFLGILGRNGAGKSTLLKIISNVVAPTSGRVKIKGRISSLLEVGTGFHPELSGMENIFLNGAILGMKRHDVRRRIEEIVEFSEIGSFIDTPVKRYSSGMYVRLAFSIAVHFIAEIVILDEVLSVGDRFFIEKSFKKMEQVLKEEGRTVLFVSHNMGKVQQLCERGILLKKGRLELEGEIGQVADIYLEKQEDKKVA